VSPGNDKTGRALLYRLGPQSFVDRVLLAWARSPATAHDTAWQSLADLPERWVAPTFPLKAADFIKRGMRPGPALGAALHEAEAAWIAADFPAAAETVAAIADAAARDIRPM
jgi:poly(A) polymerase